MVKQQQLDSSHHTLDGNIINGTTVWNERDGRHTSSGPSLTSPENRTAPVNTTPAVSNDEIDTSDYIESGRIGYLTSFHEESARIVGSNLSFHRTFSPIYADTLTSQHTANKYDE
jgi:hypothetical protein